MVRIIVLASIAMLLVHARMIRADEMADAVAVQKQTALEHLTKMEIAQPAHRETNHLLIYSSLPDARAKGFATNLEEQFVAAFKALQFDPQEMPWKGKLPVYVFAERDQFTSFLRMVEKRRPEADELGSSGENGSHAVAGPALTKDGPAPEHQAGCQLAAVLLKKKAGRGTPPDWLIEGFGRATVMHTARGGYPATKERAIARALVVQGRTVRDIWNGTLKDPELRILATSLVYFLAYGPAAGRLPTILPGYAPSEEKPMKTTEDALTEAKINLDTLDQRWQAWLRMR